MKKFKVLSRKVLIDSPFCPVEKQVVELPDGQTCDWYLNTSNDAVIVVPFLETGEVLLQRGYKHGSGEVITEFCAGLIDDGETPLETAKRELLEETGYAGNLKQSGEIFANATGSTMKYHFFIADGCRKVADQKLDKAEQIECFTVKNIIEAQKLLSTSDVKTTAATMAVFGFIRMDNYVTFSIFRISSQMLKK